MTQLPIREGDTWGSAGDSALSRLPVFLAQSEPWKRRCLRHWAGGSPKYRAHLAQGRVTLGGGGGVDSKNRWQPAGGG